MNYRQLLRLIPAVAISIHRSTIRVVPIDLIDHSVLLLLKGKFDLGIFENPYVDPDGVEQVVGSDTFREKAGLALRKSIVLLRNENSVLPLKPKTKLYFETL